MIFATGFPSADTRAPLKPRGRFFGAALLAVLLAGMLAACGASDDSSSGGSPGTSANLGPSAKLVPKELKDKTLKVVVLNDFEPFGFLEEGELVGTGPDLAKALGGVTGLNLRIEVAPFDTMITGLQAKRWDFAIPPFGISDERRKVLDFVSVDQTASGFLARDDAEFSIAGPSDLCGLTIATLRGSTQLERLNQLSKDDCEAKGQPAMQSQSFNAISDVTLALTSKRVDLMSTTNNQFKPVIAGSKVKLRAEPYEFDKTLDGMGLPKDSELGPILLQGMKDLVADGTYAKIFKKYDQEPTMIKTPELFQ